MNPKALATAILGAVLSAQLAASMASTQQTVPRFEPGACGFAPGAWAENVRLECGALVVHRSRERPTAGTLKLAVAILKPPAASADNPLVMIHGGPSGSGGLRGGIMGLAARWAPQLRRDVVVFDMRGAGLSEPVLCPQARATATDARPLTDTARQKAWIDEARECARELEAGGFDPASFSTPAITADLIDLRRSLRYASWDVYGVSYGSRVAQEAMRRDPDGVRSVILMAPVIPGPEQEAATPRGLQNGMDRVLSACASLPDCARRFPSISTDLEAVVAELAAKPLDVPFTSAGGTFSVRLDGDRLMRAIQDAFPRQAIRMPLFIDQLRRGDRLAAARLLLGFASGAASNNALTNLVGCFETGGPVVYKATVAAVQRDVRAPFRTLLNDVAECSFLQRRFATETDRAFVKSAIPALIVTQEFDDRTPASNGARIAAHLTNAHLIDIPGESHGQPPNDCSQGIMLAFLANPARRPDTQCLTTLPAVVFETASLEPVNLVLTVAAENPDHRVAGRWEGHFPNAPVIYRIELAIKGSSVTGTVTGGAQAFTVINGRYEDGQIDFAVSPRDADRLVSFSGRVEGSAMSFTRRVDVKPGASPGGAALFGVAGAGAFTLTRVR
jgi:pimeloyl-ACP methyl ester carboxylesterase